MKEPATFLFVPGDHPDRFDKALRSGADRVIADLEDAVAPDRKGMARAAVRDAIERGRRLIVRINPSFTPWQLPDLTSLKGLALDGIVLPKAEDVDTIGFIHERNPGVPILPLVESARGFSNVARMACAPGVERLLFGTIDFMLDMGICGDGDELLHFRSGIVLQSRLAGIGRPIDGATLSVDLDAVSEEAARARRLGFGGKLCIHPRQIEPVARAFCPTEAEQRRALSIIEAAERAGGGVVMLNGEMIDAPVVEMARRVVAFARERS